MATVICNTIPHTTFLSGTSLLARSIFLLNPEGSSPIQGKLGIRIAYTIPRDSDGEYPESVTDKDLGLMPMTVSMTEKFSWTKYHDVWNFIGPRLESHGWAQIPSEGNIPDTPLNYDEVGHEDDKKLDKFGLIISMLLQCAESRGIFLSHPLIKNHPVYRGLRENKHYDTHTQVQIPDEGLKSLEHHEIPLYGDIVVRRYTNWSFQEGSEKPSVSDLELRIGQAIIDDELDRVLPGLLPLRIILTEVFKGESTRDFCEDTYLIGSRRQRISHSYDLKNMNGTHEHKRDRTFSKLEDYREQISEMLSSRGLLPVVLENNPDVRDLKVGKFYGGTSIDYKDRAA